MEMNGPLDESENNIFSFFDNVRNNLTHFCGQSLNNKSLLLQAGRQYAFVNIHRWMLERQLQEGRMVTVPEILEFLQGVIHVSNEGADRAGGSEHASEGQRADGFEHASEGQTADGFEHASEGQTADASEHASDVATPLSSPQDTKMDFTSDGN